MKLLVANKNKILRYFIGAVVLALGITLSLLSNIGAGAFDALNYSLSVLLNITVGTAMYVSIFVIFVLTMILKPDLKYVLGFLLSLLTGFLIDFWMSIVVAPNTMMLSGLYFTASLILLPIGITFMIQSKMPLSPMDTLLIILIEKISKSVSSIKTVIEGSFVVLALVFGFTAGIGFGSISVGTIIITFSIGPLIQFFMKYIKPAV